MSFSFDVKQEICNRDVTKPCCKKAFAYGLALFGKSFSVMNMGIQTENEWIANLYAEILASVCGVYVDIKTKGRRKNAPGHNYMATVPDSEQRTRVLSCFGHSGDEVQLRINRAILSDDCCFASFIRGVFLACGSVADPQREYHLELVTPHLKLQSDLQALLTELGLNAKRILRKNSYVLYYKESENIEDFLTLCGASKFSMELMNVKIYKDIRNKVNRITNCETANISKTVDASTQQIDSINALKNAGYLEELSPELLEIAQLRLTNPDMSLRELGQALTIPLSRSGVNHRLKRIMEITQEKLQGKA